MVFADQAGFSLLPMAVRTWAPRGQTPILTVKLTPDHLAAMGGMTLDGRLLLQIRKVSYDSQAVMGDLSDPLTQDQGLDLAHLGRLPDPSQPGNQSLSQAGSRPTAAPGAIAGVCS